MENIIAIIVPALLLLLILRLIMLPVKLGWKLVINSACGFVCLWLVNALAPYTGLRFPVNGLTAAIAGFLGLPGLVLLALAQVLI